MNHKYKSWITLIGILITITTTFHYFTPIKYHTLHEVYKILYFIPIILSSFIFGFRGGLLSAGVVTVLYFPHVIFQWGGSFIMNISRFFMIVLYNVIGGLTGYLWQREQQERLRYQKTSEQLRVSLQKLRETSEELADIEAQLRNAERLSTLGELTASLAHEVRNPLASIKGVAEIIRDELPGDKYQKFITILLEETERLDAVVANYLNHAKPKKLIKEYFSASKILDSIIALLGPEIHKKNLSVVEKYEVPDLRIYGVETLLRQALLNVLLNAIQASSSQGEITISVEKDLSHSKIIISDKGHGIADKDLPHIFESFYTNKEDGTGLGLSISKRIIEGHGGRIYVESGLNKGTRVTMEFLNPNESQTE